VKAVLVAILAVQLLVPAVVLVTQGRPAQFGWHMYAAVTPPPRIDAVTPDGRERVPIRTAVAKLRPDVVYPPAQLARVACRATPDASTVIVRSSEPMRRTVHPC
jgi:hypothetical protein